MRVLVTGARGKVGRAAVAALMGAGHDVRATDLFPPVFERPEFGEPEYVQADLTDAIVLAVESDLPGHEVFYIASPDNAGGARSRGSCASTTATGSR